MAQGEALRLPFPDKFFHCVMTSPPYWGMRAYSGEQMRVWGGDPNCDHKWIDEIHKMQTGGQTEKQMTNKGVDGSGWTSKTKDCLKCDMWIGPLGHEPTPKMFARNMVLIFNELGRVTRDDAVIWLNLGDSSSKGGAVAQGNRTFIPHRVALALQEAGWHVRQEVIWNKPNPMVESVTGWRWERHRIKVASADVDWREEAKAREGLLDGPTHVAGGNTGTKGYRPEWKTCPGCERCEPNGGYVHLKGSWRHTTSHEAVLQVVKKNHYFCDQTLVLEETSETSHGALEPGAGAKQEALGQNQGPSTLGVKTEYRNPRSVMEIPAGNYPGAHYATYPPQLITPLIRAACPTKACSVCGTAWSPVMDLDSELKPTVKIDYRPSCLHRSSAVPGWVLDPFFGSGTTGEVAKMLGVNFAGVDISYDYLSENARVRAFGQTPPKALDDLPLFSPAAGDD